MKNKTTCWNKEWRGILYTLFIALITVGCQQQSQTASNQPTVAESQEGQVKTSGEIHKPGDKVTVGKLNYTVRSVSMKKEISDGNETKVSEGPFLILNVMIENLGQEPQLMDVSLFKIKDGQGREFEPMVDVDQYVNKEKNFFLEDLHPQSSLEGNIIFELPSDASDLKLAVSSGIGFEANQAEIVDLGNPSSK